VSDAERLDPLPRWVEPPARRGGERTPDDGCVLLAAVLARPLTTGDGESCPRRSPAAFGKPLVTGRRARGLALRAIADRLNAGGHTAQTGAAWSDGQVCRSCGP